MSHIIFHTRKNNPRRNMVVKLDYYASGCHMWLVRNMYAYVGGIKIKTKGHTPPRGTPNTFSRKCGCGEIHESNSFEVQAYWYNQMED